jgi:hypothetical protein
MSGRRSRNKGARVERGIVRASVSGIGSRRKGKIGKKIMQKLTSIKAIVPYLNLLIELIGPPVRGAVNWQQLGERRRARNPPPRRFSW